LLPTEVVLLHLRSTRLATPALRWMNATCVPSSEMIGEVSTIAPVPVLYDQKTSGAASVTVWHEEYRLFTAKMVGWPGVPAPPARVPPAHENCEMPSARVIALPPVPALIA